MNDPDGIDLVQICLTYGQLEAQVVKSKLESFDIPVLLDYESLGIVMGLTVDGLGKVRVLVPRERAEEARALLEEDEGLPNEDEGDESERRKHRRCLKKTRVRPTRTTDPRTQ